MILINYMNLGRVEFIVKRFGDREIIIRDFFGEINVEEVIESFAHISQQLINASTAGIITDTTLAGMNISPRELGKVIKFIRDDKNLKKLKLAVIVNTPEKTVLPALAASKLTSIKLKPFSGKEAAIRWILR